MSIESASELTAPQVAAYLRAHPHFLEEHPDVLSQIVLSLGAGATVSSLLERQVLTLREKVKLLEQRQALMLRHAQENEAIQRKLTQLVRALLISRDARARADLLTDLLGQHFSLPVVEIIVVEASQAQSSSLQTLCDAQRPSCWSAASDQGAAVLRHLQAPSEAVGSLAFLPLQPPPEGRPARALVLGAGDPARFEPGQGIVFLERIAEIASAALHACDG